MELTDKILEKFVRTKIGYIIATHARITILGVGSLALGYFYGKVDNESITTDAIESALIATGTGVLTKYINRTDGKMGLKTRW